MSAPIGEKLRLIIEEAERRIMNGPRSYIGDPDHWSQETLKSEMKRQDEQAIKAEVMRMIREL